MPCFSCFTIISIIYKLFVVINLLHQKVYKNSVEPKEGRLYSWMLFSWLITCKVRYMYFKVWYCDKFIQLNFVKVDPILSMYTYYCICPLHGASLTYMYLHLLRNNSKAQELTSQPKEEASESGDTYAKQFHTSSSVYWFCLLISPAVYW